MCFRHRWIQRLNCYFQKRGFCALLVSIALHWLYGWTLLVLFVGSVAQAAPAEIESKTGEYEVLLVVMMGARSPSSVPPRPRHLGIELNLSLCFWFWFCGGTAWVISQEIPCGSASAGVGCACGTLRSKVAWAPHSCFSGKSKACLSFLAGLLEVPTYGWDWDRGRGEEEEEGGLAGW